MKLFDEADINRMANELAAIAATPELLTALQSIQDGSAQDALSSAKRVASLEYLKSQGIEPPKDFRITTRSFEPPELAPIADATTPVTTFENGRLVVKCGGWVVSVTED